MGDYADEVNWQQRVIYGSQFKDTNNKKGNLVSDGKRYGKVPGKSY